MNVITIESEAFLSITRKLENLENEFIKMIKKTSTPLSDTWLDNEDVCHLLKISKRTLQNYREENVIPYSQIKHKIYYRASDIDAILKNGYKKLIKR